jgi:hypothetical protein
VTVRVARLLLATIVVSAGLVIGVDAMVVSDPTPSTERGTIERRSLDGVTMVSSQSEGLFFLSERGDVIARLTREDTYFDADRIPEAGDRTVLYTAANYRPADRCGFPTECIENRVVRYNLSTGERRVLFNMTTSSGTTRTTSARSGLWSRTWHATAFSSRTPRPASSPGSGRHIRRTTPRAAVEPPRTGHTSTTSRCCPTAD